MRRLVITAVVLAGLVGCQQRQGVDQTSDAAALVQAIAKDVLANAATSNLAAQYSGQAINPGIEFEGEATAGFAVKVRGTYRLTGVSVQGTANAAAQSTVRTGDPAPAIAAPLPPSSQPAEGER